MKYLITILLILLCFVCNASKLNITESHGTYSVRLLNEQGDVCLQGAKTGLWRIGTTWENQWATDWVYGYPSSIEHVNGFTILSGEIKINNGIMIIKDAYSMDNDLVKCTRRYTWTGDLPLNNVTLAIEYLFPESSERLLMPGIMYYGNPSGAESGRTPIWKGESGDMALFEEHRFPMPFVCFEGDESSVSLHSMPSAVPYANLEDQWWSLGAQAVAEGTMLSLFSGPCAFNGQKSVIKTHQGKHRSMSTPYDHATLTIPSGGIIEKTFYLDAYTHRNMGSGFQKSVEASISIFDPSLEGLPTRDKIVSSKINYAKSRWIEGDHFAGFNQFSDQTDKAYIVLGWVGQAAAPGFAFQNLGSDQPELLKMAQKSLDFISTAHFYEKGIYTWFHVDKNLWGGRVWNDNPELLSQAQTMYNVAKAIVAAEQTGLDQSKWRAFFKKSVEFHVDRMLDASWQPRSTNEAFFIAPFCMAYQILHEERYLLAAQKVGDYYANRHSQMKEPYWGGTLDASCEDKEGTFAAFQGFLHLYESTLDSKYLELAKHACYLTISYTYLWDVELPAGRLRDHLFCTRGWTSVSVQNMHIDIYGVLIAPFVYKMGQYLDDDQLKKLGVLMYRSCGQLIDMYGSQGEQSQQTNYTQAHDAGDNYLRYRGNYVEDWTVFWITAHFLTGAAMFEEIGVDF